MRRAHAATAHGPVAPGPATHGASPRWPSAHEPDAQGASPSAPRRAAGLARRGRCRRLAAGACLALLAWAAASDACAQFNGSFALEKLHLNRENWLDWRAYQPPPEWRQDAYRQPNAMQASVGSLSQVRFFQAIEIRLEKDLGPYATILYTQDEYSFFGTEPPYQEAKMRFGAKGFYGSIIGFPSADKSLGSQGLAAAWGKRTDPNTVRLSYLQEQALFNEKTEGTARYAIAPILNRLQARFFPGERVRIEVDYRDEPTARLVSPDLHKQETYQAQKFDGWADWSVRDDLVLGLVASDNTERRQTLPDAAGPGTPAREQALTWGWSELHGVWTLGGGDVLTLAVVQSAFENVIQAPDPAFAYHFRLRTTQAYALWEVLRSAWFRWTFSLQVAEVHKFEAASKDEAERNDSPSFEGKFGFGLILAEERQYRLWLLSTWAPDAISGQKWDGGNMQFQLFF